MTAINVFVQRNRAIMMTDGAMYLASGLVVGFGMKAVAIPNLKAAVAVRGAQKATALLAMDMSIRYRDFDHMANSAADDLEEWYDAHVLSLANSGQQDLEIVVVGWSEQRQRPAGLVYSSQGEGMFEHMEVGDDILGPMPDDIEDARLHSIGCEPGIDFTASNFDPVRHGIPLMEAQRRMQIVAPGVADGAAIHIVGGHVMATEVNRDGVSQRIIHHWNDVVGELIEPEPFKKLDTAGLSRQQRRAMERRKRFV